MPSHVVGLAGVVTGMLGSTVGLVHPTLMFDHQRFRYREALYDK